MYKFNEDEIKSRYASEREYKEARAEALIRVLRRDKSLFVNYLSKYAENTFGEFIRAYIQLNGDVSEEEIVEAMAKHVRVLMFVSDNPHLHVCVRDGEIVVQNYGDEFFCVGLGDEYKLYLLIQPHHVSKAFGVNVKAVHPFQRTVATSTDPYILEDWFDLFSVKDVPFCYGWPLGENRFVYFDGKLRLRDLFYMRDSGRAKAFLTDAEYKAYIDALEYIESILAE